MNTKTQHYELTIGDARSNLADISNRVAYTGERIVIKRYRKAIVALVPIEDLELLDALENEHDINLSRQRLKTINKTGTTTLKALEKELKSNEL